jgi:hypothetical protein
VPGNFGCGAKLVIVSQHEPSGTSSLAAQPSAVI